MSSESDTNGGGHRLKRGFLGSAFAACLLLLTQSAAFAITQFPMEKLPAVLTLASFGYLLWYSMRYLKIIRQVNAERRADDYLLSIVILVVVILCIRFTHVPQLWMKLVAFLTFLGVLKDLQVWRYAPSDRKSHYIDFALHEALVGLVLAAFSLEQAKAMIWPATILVTVYIFTEVFMTVRRLRSDGVDIFSE